MLDWFRATVAGLLRRSAGLLSGDNTGVISRPDPADRALDEAADSYSVPAQDPVTPEALALLRARGPADTIPDSPCAHGTTEACAACAYEATHGPGARSTPPSDAMPAGEFFEAERSALRDAKKSPIPVFRRRFLP